MREISARVFFVKYQKVSCSVFWDIIKYKTSIFNVFPAYEQISKIIFQIFPAFQINRTNRGPYDTFVVPKYENSLKIRKKVPKNLIIRFVGYYSFTHAWSECRPRHSKRLSGGTQEVLREHL